MLDKLLNFITGDSSADEAKIDDIQMSVAALLVEAAAMDAVFDDKERAAIRGVLADAFHLDETDTDTLLNAAIKVNAKSVQTFGFTRGMAKRLSYEDRVHLIEMLWQVAYADHALSAEEDMLIRRVAGLIYVSDADRGAARRRVLEQKQISDSP